MNNLKLTLNFTDTAEQEVRNLVEDIRLIPLVTALSKHQDDLPPDVSQNLTKLIEFISDLFSTSLPDIDKDPEVTLRTISRDINLSRLLRERGLFRLYKFITHTVEVDMLTGLNADEYSEFTDTVPLFYLMENPDSEGDRFTSQEDFIGWFCSNAHVSRSLVFQRIATINKVLSLGFSLDEAFNIITKKPSVIKQMLQMIGEWDSSELISIDSNTALQIAEHSGPELFQDVTNLLSSDNYNQDALVSMLKPALANMVEEVAYHDRSQGALDFIKYDILGEPEILYRWDTELDCLVIEFVHKVIDENGQEYELSNQKIVMMPDTRSQLPDAVRKDLIKRLPIRNKNSLDK